jgi:hypothetical protein
MIGFVLSRHFPGQAGPIDPEAGTYQAALRPDIALGLPGRTRTCGPWSRKPVLWSAELRRDKVIGVKNQGGPCRPVLLTP